MSSGLSEHAKESVFCKRLEVAFPLNLLCVKSLETKWVPEVKGLADEGYERQEKNPKMTPRFGARKLVRWVRHQWRQENMWVEQA